MCYTFHISPPAISHQTTFPVQHTIPHLTSFHITPHISIPPDHTSHGMMWNSVAWNLVWCGMFCNARCGVLCLVHPNVAVMWNKVRCRINIARCDAKCDVVQCQMRCWEMWWCDVEWWCGTWGLWWCAVTQDVTFGCGIPGWCEMVWCHIWHGDVMRIYLTFYAQSTITVISGRYTFCRYTLTC